MPACRLAGESLTAANLKAVFDLDAEVMRAPSTGRPICVPALGVATIPDLRQEVPA
ncbi:hypothetical protein [Halomonas sp. NCCP-2165]|nr:hypothetical protein [Halomonas sp. NCCP-2165]GKW49024.1 hypothetical protein NCCP2165_12390 [Halomonas sp. NCCP-2165]